MTLPDTHAALAQKVAEHFIQLPQVEAVTLGGSFMSAMADTDSDIDVCAYTSEEVPVAQRRAIVNSLGASQTDLGLTFWGPSDSWFDAATGLELDVSYFDALWMETQLERVLRDHQASLGYSTAFWHTVRGSQILHDPKGWFAKLQERSKWDYPEALRRNIIALNHPALRNTMPSLLNQLRRAVQRRDLVSVNHRVAGFFASYFDILFALNRVLHPGEKRLLTFAQERCERLPVNMEADVKAVLRASSTADSALIRHLDTLMDHLDELLSEEGFDPDTSRPKAVGGA